LDHSKSFHLFFKGHRRLALQQQANGTLLSTTLLDFTQLTLLFLSQFFSTQITSNLSFLSLTHCLLQPHRTTGRGLLLSLLFLSEARVGSTALVLRVLKKDPRIEGRVDLNSPDLSVVVTWMKGAVVEDIDPASVVDEGGVIVV